ncbi:TIGR03899 family protein [Shewanella sp. Scap07]|uniref:TIGR03899 family protein n=1 Tax=Shewanella sp. Scap07 TaxID=2589987 RepID=UPI0015B90136|nr:TIGR03899 family protein [Shewanella sp. Scap07]QLE86769.1 TIGR03899 family protein [Shewanella sp. Scap07]
MADTPSVPKSEQTSDVSARKKALLLGRRLGLTSEEGYRASQASIAERAEHRQRKLDSQYQANLEAVYTIALANTPSEVTGTDLDPDWVHQFFQLAEQIHNRKMQELWGRILAYEITSPGNFSLRTLATLKQLTHKEAQFFEKALAMAVKINNESRHKLIIGYRYAGGIGKLFRKTDAISIGLSQFGLPYSTILTLIDSGILHRSEFETGLLNSKTPISFTLQDMKMTLTPKGGHLLFSYYRLTPVGEELAQLVRPGADIEYTKAIKALFAKDFIID